MGEEFAKISFERVEQSDLSLRDFLVCTLFLWTHEPLQATYSFDRFIDGLDCKQGMGVSWSCFCLLSSYCHPLYVFEVRLDIYPLCIWGVP